MALLAPLRQIWIGKELPAECDQVRESFA